MTDTAHQRSRRILPLWVLVTAAAALAVTGWLLTRSGKNGSLGVVADWSSSPSGIDQYWASGNVGGDLLLVSGPTGVTEDRPLGFIVALERATGEEVWSQDLEGFTPGVVLADEDVVVVDRSDPRGPAIYRAASGELLWAAEVPASLSSAVRTDAGLHLVGTFPEFDAHVLTVDPATGERVWVAQLRGRNPEAQTSAVSNGILYVATPDMVAAIETSSGDRLWEIVLETNDESAPDVGGVWAGGDSGIALSTAKELVGFDAASGEISWRLPVDGSATLFPVGERGAILDQVGETRLIDPGGETVWQLVGSDQCDLDLAGASGGLILGEILFMDTVLAIDPGTGAIVWSHEGRLEYTHVLFETLDDVYVVVTREDLWIIDRETGELTFSKRIESQLQSTQPVFPVVADRTVYTIVGDRSVVEAYQLDDLIAYGRAHPDHHDIPAADPGCLALGA